MEVLNKLTHLGTNTFRPGVNNAHTSKKHTKTYVITNSIIIPPVKRLPYHSIEKYQDGE